MSTKSKRFKNEFVVYLQIGCHPIHPLRTYKLLHIALCEIKI
jgi:hypothetical protein